MNEKGKDVTIFVNFVEKVVAYHDVCVLLEREFVETVQDPICKRHVVGLGIALQNSLIEVFEDG